MIDISQHITMSEATRSKEATAHGLRNIPGSKEIQAMQYVAQSVFEPLRAYFGQPIRIDQLGTVVGDIKLDVLGQSFEGGSHLLANGFDHLLGVLASTGERHAKHHLLAVLGHRAGAQCRRRADIRHIPDIDPKKGEKQ